MLFLTNGCLPWRSSNGFKMLLNPRSLFVIPFLVISAGVTSLAAADVREAAQPDVWCAWHKLTGDKPDFRAMTQPYMSSFQTQSERGAGAKEIIAAYQKRYDSFDPENTEFTLRVNTHVSEYDEKAGGYWIDLFSGPSGVNFDPAQFAQVGVNAINFPQGINVDFINGPECRLLKSAKAATEVQFQAVDLVIDPVAACYDLGHELSRGDGYSFRLECRVRSVKGVWKGPTTPEAILGEATYPAADASAKTAVRAAPVYANDVVISGLWQKIAGKAKPNCENAAKLSDLYKNASEFAKPRVLTWLASVLDHNADLYGAGQPVIFFPSEGAARAKLQYDMDHKGFKTGIATMGFSCLYPYTRVLGNNQAAIASIPYNAVFSNEKDAEFITMDPSDAEGLMQTVGSQSHFTEVTAVPESAVSEENLATSGTPREVRFHITKIQIFSGDNNLGSRLPLMVKTFDAPTAPAKAVVAADTGLDPFKVDINGLKCGTLDTDFVAAAIKAFKRQIPPLPGSNALRFGSLVEVLEAQPDVNHNIYMMHLTTVIKGYATKDAADALIKHYGPPISDTGEPEMGGPVNRETRNIEWIKSEGTGAQLSAEIVYNPAPHFGRPNTTTDLVVRVPGKFDPLKQDAPQQDPIAPRSRR